jgi:hypothetical protein
MRKKARHMPCLEHPTKELPMIPSMSRKTFLRLLAILLLAVSTIPVAPASAVDPHYTLEQVVEACGNAYGNVTQFITCVNNVCGYYGCS